MKTCLYRVLFALLALAAPTWVVAAEQTPFNGRPFSVGERIEAEDFDLGGEGVGYHGVGGVVSNVVLFANYRITNVFDPVPRNRHDSDIGVAVDGSATYLALRPEEWACYTIFVETDGDYVINVRTMGGAGPTTIDCPNGPPSFAPSRFSLRVDDRVISRGILAQQRVTTSRFWLSSGPHRIRLTAEWVPTPFGPCYATASNPIPFIFTLWWTRTLPIDWLQIVPAAVPLQPIFVAGGAQGFVDGSGTNAGMGLPKMFAENPAGELVVLDEYANSLRLVSRAGNITTLAGFPGNPRRDGVGTNAGFGQILQCLPTPNSEILVLQLENGTNSAITRVSPNGQATTVFNGLAVIPNVSTQFPDGSITGTNWATIVSRLQLDANGAVEALASFRETVPFREWVTEEHWGFASFQLLGDGSLQYLSKTYWKLVTSSLDEGAFAEGYRLDGGIIFAVEDGFQQPILALKDRELRSSFRTSDGELWSADTFGRIYQLAPKPNAHYLTVSYPNDGRVAVSGVPQWAIDSDQAVRLEVKSKKGFWTLSSWSDGNTDNPRTLTINQDTTLVANLEQRLPIEHGIAPKTVSVAANGRLRFALIGPPDGSTGYSYRIEMSGNLKSWQTVPSVTVLGVSGQSSGSDVAAAQPSTLVEVPVTGDQRFFRVSLVY